MSLNEVKAEDPVYIRDMETIEQLRTYIDKLDRTILETINLRLLATNRIGALKGLCKSPKEYYAPEREKAVIKSLMERNDGPLEDRILSVIFREIMSAGLASQTTMRIGYHGAPKSATNFAVHERFGHSVLAIPYPDLLGILEALNAGTIDYAMVQKQGDGENEPEFFIVGKP